jgi:hypothetical protein
VSGHGYTSVSRTAKLSQTVCSHIERIQHEADLRAVKVEPLSQMYDLWIHVDVVQDVRDEAIFLAELRLIVEEGATLFKRKAEVTNDLRQ